MGVLGNFMLTTFFAHLIPSFYSLRPPPTRSTIGKKKAVKDIVTVSFLALPSITLDFPSLFRKTSRAVVTLYEVDRRLGEALKLTGSGPFFAYNKGSLSEEEGEDSSTKTKGTPLLMDARLTLPFSLTAFRLAEDARHFLRMAEKNQLHGDLFLIGGEEKEFFSNPWIMLEAARCCLSSLRFTTKSLRGNKEFMLNLISRIPSGYIYANVELLMDRDFFLDAAIRNAESLRFAPSWFGQNKELILEIVRQSGSAEVLRYADWSLRSDRSLILHAAEIDKTAMLWAAKELKGNLN